MLAVISQYKNFQMRGIGEIFDVRDVVNKTLMAKIKVPVYAQPRNDAAAFGYVAPGQPVGVVYSWLDPAPAKNRTTIWFMYESPEGFYYTPLIGGYYDVSALREQGVISIEEKVELEKEAAADAQLSLVERLVKQYAPWVLGTVVAVAAVKGIIQKV